MVCVTVLDEFPWHFGDDGLTVPLDVGRWAVITGGTPELRRRVAEELRVLSHRPVHLAPIRRPTALSAA